jgi:hypothetical protein
LLQEGFCCVLSVFWEVAPAVFGATGFGAKGVQADVQAEAGDPVFEGSCGFVAVEVFEELDEDVLNEVLCCGASGEMIGNDAIDLGVECFDEPRGGGFVSRGLPCDEVVLARGWHGARAVMVRIHLERGLVTEGRKKVERRSVKEGCYSLAARLMHYLS